MTWKYIKREMDCDKEKMMAREGGDFNAVPQKKIQTPWVSNSTSKTLRLQGMCLSLTQT